MKSYNTIPAEAPAPASTQASTRRLSLAVKVALSFVVCGVLFVSGRTPHADGAKLTGLMWDEYQTGNLVQASQVTRTSDAQGQLTVDEAIEDLQGRVTGIENYLQATTGRETSKILSTYGGLEQMQFLVRTARNPQDGEPTVDESIEDLQGRVVHIEKYLQATSGSDTSSQTSREWHDLKEKKMDGASFAVRWSTMYGGLQQIRSTREPQDGEPTLDEAVEDLQARVAAIEKYLQATDNSRQLKQWHSGNFGAGAFMNRAAPGPDLEDRVAAIEQFQTGLGRLMEQYHSPGLAPSEIVSRNDGTQTTVDEAVKNLQDRVAGIENYLQATSASGTGSDTSRMMDGYGGVVQMRFLVRSARDPQDGEPTVAEAIEDLQARVVVIELYLQAIADIELYLQATSETSRALKQYSAMARVGFAQRSVPQDQATVEEAIEDLQDRVAHIEKYLQTPGGSGNSRGRLSQGNVVYFGGEGGGR